MVVEDFLLDTKHAHDNFQSNYDTKYRQLTLKQEEEKAS